MEKISILKVFLWSVSKSRRLVKIWAKSVEKWLRLGYYRMLCNLNLGFAKRVNHVVMISQVNLKTSGEATSFEIHWTREEEKIDSIKLIKDGAVKLTNYERYNYIPHLSRQKKHKFFCHDASKKPTKIKCIVSNPILSSSRCILGLLPSH